VKSENYEVPHHVIFYVLFLLSRLLGPNILFSTLFSNALNLDLPCRVREQVDAHKKQRRVNYSSVYFNIYVS